MLAVTTALMLASFQGAPDALPTVDPAVWTTVGAQIPDLQLPRVDGQGAVELSQFRGKKLLLVQFASW